MKSSTWTQLSFLACILTFPVSMCTRYAPEQGLKVVGWALTFALLVLGPSLRMYDVRNRNVTQMEELLWVSPAMCLQTCYVALTVDLIGLSMLALLAYMYATLKAGELARRWR